MNQLNWTYLADDGKKHYVGIYHGAQSGHLLVYCNNKVVLVDFSVLKDATYSFFIEDQLCELDIELREGQFYYGFNLNMKADTPRNRLRKKKEKKYLFQSLGFIAGLALLVLGTVFGMNQYHQNKQEKGIATLLHEFGKEADAKILISSENPDHSVSYFFLVNGKGYTVHSKVQIEHDIILENGMPLEKGDEFVVRYLPENPSLCEIDYDRPTNAQLELYIERAAREYLKKNPSATEDEIACLTQIAYDLKGISGLADFYYQNTPPSENPNNNIESFQRLVRDIPFQKETRKRCGFSG